MTRAGTLAERKAAVLHAVVSDYIRSGEPVGSGVVAARSGLGVSPATIRNDMATLEELGFLHQPHTSAGRVPTDRGYRYFVDHLPRWPRLPEPKQRAIARFFGEAPEDPQEVVRGTIVLLSRVTRYGVVARQPGSEHVVLGGTSNIVGEDTFEHRDTVRRLLELLEQEQTVLELLEALAGEGEIAVRIGRENPLAAMRETSVVVAPYRSGPRRIGAIAVIGPTRMHYPEAISAIHDVSRRLSSTIQALAG
jgi:transcriptional regulator of heat shock response